MRSGSAPFAAVDPLEESETRPRGAPLVGRRFNGVDGNRLMAPGIARLTNPNH